VMILFLGIIACIQHTTKRPSRDVTKVSHAVSST